jgi:cellulose synthase/poly-beta-1,6-N-acetylglucosamine synthase-like glycosyltransferase
VGIVDITIIILVGLVVYCYGIYPYAIQLVAKVFKRPTFEDASYLPHVSIVVAAHNEEVSLPKLLDSLLALDYPKDLVEIIIASDGSDDKTNEILTAYAERDERIKPLLFKEQRGKMPTLNDAVAGATGEILYFVDADLTLSSNSLRAHTRHHIDPSVGIVAGAYQMVSSDSRKLRRIEEAYASLEQRIRASEGDFASTMNVYGGNYSMRRALWRPLPSSMVHDDLFVVFSVIRQGKRVISDRETIAYDKFPRSFNDEFLRKIRSASRGYPTLAYFPEVVFFQLIPESFLLWPHKILRWLSPFFITMAGMLALWRYFQTRGAVYGIFVLVLGITVVIGAITYFFEKRGHSLPFFGKLGWFVAMNYAYVVGTYRFITGRDNAAWKKASRNAA